MSSLKMKAVLGTALWLFSFVNYASALSNEVNHAAFLSVKGSKISVNAATETAERTRVNAISLNMCALIEGRSFEFRDDMCGTRTFAIADMMTAFQTEQEYWAGQGTTDPWWAVDTAFPHGEVYPRQRKLEFYKAGVDTWNDEFVKVKAAGLLKPGWTAQKTALDFGCGLGRMSNALAAIGFQTVKCLDQASTFLDAARQNLGELAGQGVVVSDVAERVVFVRSEPDLLCVEPPASVDFVHSTITLQHMKPHLQMAYVEQLCDLLRGGGAGVFQIPTFIHNTDKEGHCSLTQEYGGMAMHYTPQAEVERHLTLRGCKVLSATDHDLVGPIGKSMLFIFQKPP